LEGFSDGEATFTISISKDNRERKLLVVLTFARRLSAAKHEAYTSLVKKKEGAPFCWKKRTPGFFF
jgi:hypothetical protein